MFPLNQESYFFPLGETEGDLQNYKADSIYQDGDTKVTLFRSRVIYGDKEEDYDVVGDEYRDRIDDEITRLAEEHTYDQQRNSLSPQVKRVERTGNGQVIYLTKQVPNCRYYGVYDTEERTYLLQQIVT